MRLLFVADGRSPTTRNWIRYWTERGDDVFLASTFPCDPIPSLAGLYTVSAAFSGRGASSSSVSQPRDARLISIRQTIRHWLGPLTLPHDAKRLRELVERVQPDLVHALRIPYEGMLAAEAVGGRVGGGISIRSERYSTAAVSRPPRFIVSVWGNDFTLHAPSTPLMKYHTRKTMLAADALHADCQRDIRLAREWGLDPVKPTLVTPGNGGIHTDIFFPPAPLVEEPVIFNPRGFRAYVRNDTFFQSIPFVLKEVPSARFVCAGMAGQPEALSWVSKLGIENAVELLEPRPHAEMADVYRSAMILVSPSTHDGTPNTLLEGMACGCFPIAGDLESIREWITDGENGLLVDPTSPSALANTILKTIKDKDLRVKAAGLNREIIAERAEYARNMAKAEMFYRKMIGKS